MRRVPLGRRNLLADRRRLAAGVVGVGLAVMLILLLDGMWAGLRRQTTLYTDRAGADVYVLQPGVRDLTAGAGVLPLSALDVVLADPDVAWAAPVRTAYVVLELGGTKVPTFFVGSVPGQRGGAWAMVSGRRPAADDEVVVARSMARRRGLRVGGSVDVGGRPLRIVGLASDADGFMVPFVFATHAAVDRMTAESDTTTFVMAASRNPEAAMARLRAGGLNALGRDEVAANTLKLMTGIFGSPIRLMVGTALAAGTLIIALTGYTAVVERRREYGIVKAVGGSGRRLAALALAQTLALAGLGLGAGGLLYLAGRAVIVEARPQFSIVLTSGSAARAAGAALGMALIAALVPARGLAKVEPAAAYRSAS